MPVQPEYVTSHLEELLKKGEARILNATYTLYAQPRNISADEGILVLIPRSMLGRTLRKNEWSPEALHLGYDKKLLYTYSNTSIEIYYPSTPKALRRAPSLPPLVKGVEISMYWGVWSNGKIRAVRLVHNLNPTALYKLYRGAASLLARGEEELKIPLAKLSSMESLSTSSDPGDGAYLWYLRFWRDNTLHNQTVSGQSTATLTDYFTTKSNTTSYHLSFHLKPLSNTGRTVHVEAYVNGSLVLYEDMQELNGTSYDYEASITSSDPSDLSNKVWEVKVVLSGLDSDGSEWLVNVVPTARAWIQPVSGENGVIDAKAHYYGTVSVKYSEEEGYVDGQYEINPDSGDALLLFTGAEDIVEGESPQPGFTVSITSTSDQLYDRYVDVYINDHYIGSCLAYTPGIPNGTAALRGCTLQVNDISPYIIESMKLGSTPIIRVVIEGYSKNPPYDYRKWFISESHTSFYTKAFIIWGSEYSDYYIDPTTPPGFAYSYVTPSEFYVGASYGYSSWLNTDIQQTLITLGYPGKVHVGDQSNMDLEINIPIGSRWPAEGSMSHRLLHADILLEGEQADKNLVVSGYAYVPQGGAKRKDELLSIIKAALSIGSMFSNLVSNIPGIGLLLSLGLQIINSPNIFYYGATYTLSYTDHGARLVWDAGYSDIASGEFTLKVSLLPSNGWNSNPIYITASGYVQVYCSKDAPSSSYATQDTVISLDFSKNITVLPG